MTPTNEQIAAWLDPDRKRDGWWREMRWCSKCGSDHSSLDIPAGCPQATPVTYKYTGPDFYDAAVCEVDVVPVVLDAGCQYWRTHEFTQISRPINTHFNEITRHHHHPTACILALAKIKEVNQ